MTHLRLPATTSDRQMNLLFDIRSSEGLTSLERDKVISTLAQILMQAAGYTIEELDDDKH